MSLTHLYYYKILKAYVDVSTTLSLVYLIKKSIFAPDLPSTYEKNNVLRYNADVLRISVNLVH